MYLRRLSLAVLFIGSLFTTPLVVASVPAPSGVWKTVFYKRGFVGSYQSKWASGPDGQGLVRLPIIFPVDGSKVRVWLNSAREDEVVLDHLSLAPGVNRQGGTDGRFFPITFNEGQPGVTIAPLTKAFVSDEVSMPVKAGVWYLQEDYSSEKYPYAYDADGAFCVSDPAERQPSPTAHRKGSWLGSVFRIDVLTTDPRPVLVCFGDSITQGAQAIPNAGNRYPELLGKLLHRPVLNLGVNGDQAKYSRGLSGILSKLDGVDTVVLLIGINDIISGSLKDPADYIKTVTATIAAIKRAGCKVYLGTIMPAGGYEKFDADPAKEELRQLINVWIRSRPGVDGVIDFDAALCDPRETRQLRAGDQDDWLHPNDAGYQRMAETAAAVLK